MPTYRAKISQPYVATDGTVQIASAGQVIESYETLDAITWDLVSEDPQYVPASTPLAAEPANPTPGLIVLADRVHWDPLGLGTGGAYQTMYLGEASGWGAITGQLD